jgi:hypothetical protein
MRPLSQQFTAQPREGNDPLKRQWRTPRFILATGTLSGSEKSYTSITGDSHNHDGSRSSHLFGSAS